MSDKQVAEHGIFASAVAPLSYRQKFILIALLFLISTGGLIYVIFGQTRGGQAFAERERMGVAYIGPMRQLLQDVLGHEELAIRSTAGEMAVRPDLRKQQEKVEQSLRGIDAVDQRLGKALL